MAEYYNPYSQLAKIRDYNFNIDNQGIVDRFNARIARETAARQTPQGQPQGQLQGQGLNAGMFMGAVGQLGDALARKSSNPYDFSTNNAAPFVGAAQGFATGGPIGAAIGAVSGIINRRESYKQADQNLRAINTGIELTDIDPATGRPSFNSRAAIDADSTIGSLNAAGKKRLKNRFRSHDDTILAHQMGIKSNELSKGLQSGRDDFNSAMQNYNFQQQSMQQYNQLLNNQDRLRNLYSIGQNLY